MNASVTDFFANALLISRQTGIADSFADSIADPVFITKLRSTIPSQTHLPILYVEFLTCHAIPSLDLPFLQLYRTDSKRTLRDLLSIFRSLAPSGYIPLGADSKGEGVFCIDINASHSQPISLVRYESSPDDYVISDLFSSFDAFLRVMTAALINGTDMVVPDHDGPAMIEELRKLDPCGFGGEGWVNYWSKRLSRYVNP